MWSFRLNHSLVGVWIVFRVMKYTLEVNVITFFFCFQRGGFVTLQTAGLWQTTGRQWQHSPAKYSTSCSNSSERENMEGPPTRAQDGGKSPPSTRHRHHFIHCLSLFFYVIAKKILYYSTYVGHFPPTVNVDTGKTDFINLKNICQFYHREKPLFIHILFVCSQ